MWPNHPEAKPGAYPPLPMYEDERVAIPNVSSNDQRNLTTAYTEHAVRFIEKNKDRPFFLYLAHSMVHVPLFVSDTFAGKTERGLFGDVMSEVDWSVGQVLDTLQRLGLEKNTIVIFTSDNGPWLSYGDHAGSAGPLREGKGTAFEGGVREPFLIRWPGRIPAGRVSDEPAMTIDLLPTFAKLIGATPPANRIDGLDIWPVLAGAPGAKNPHEAYFFYYADNELRAVRSGPWKLYFPHASRSMKGQAPGRGGIPGRYVQEKVGLELYDLSKDTGETANVADANPDAVKRLLALADTMRADLGDSLTQRKPTGNRPPGRMGP
jgi:arylsulfatase A-like enzyme